MTTFLTLIGFILAVVVFLYFLQAVDSGKRALNGQTQPDSRPATNPSATTAVARNGAGTAGNWNCLPDDLKNQLPGRRCPLCSRTLTRDEPLYATFVETGADRKIMIHGCPYCYKSMRYDESRDRQTPEQTINA